MREKERVRERELTQNVGVLCLRSMQLAWQMQTDLHCAAVDRLFDPWEH